MRSQGPRRSHFARPNLPGRHPQGRHGRERPYDYRYPEPTGRDSHRCGRGGRSSGRPAQIPPGDEAGVVGLGPAHVELLRARKRSSPPTPPLTARHELDAVILEVPPPAMRDRPTGDASTARRSPPPPLSAARRAAPCRQGCERKSADTRSPPRRPAFVEIQHSDPAQLLVVHCATRSQSAQPPTPRPVRREFVRKYALETGARRDECGAPGVDQVPFVATPHL
jgi:hypothetical protein